MEITSDEYLALPGIGRLGFDADGKARLKYRAIDPAEKMFQCYCGKPECQIRRLRPFRDHIRKLYRIMAVCLDINPEYDAVLDSPLLGYKWEAVLYSLQMAGSLEDVFADTSFVDDSEGIIWCEPVQYNEALHSEITAKYVAGASILNFIWSGYEAAIELSSNYLKDIYKKDKAGARGRRIAAELSHLEKNIPLIDKLYKFGVHCCKKVGDLDDSIEKINSDYHLTGLAAAAELVRIYRNHLAHGKDKVPSHISDWSENGCGKDNFVVNRMYTICRLLLILIQAFAVASLSEPLHFIPETLSRNCVPDKEAQASLLDAHWLAEAEDCNTIQTT